MRVRRYEDDEPEHQLDSRGPFTCEYCAENYTLRKYELFHPGERKWYYFCCPECVMGYDGYILNTWASDPKLKMDHEKANRIYKEMFGREVIPAPRGVFIKTDKRKRSEWLPQIRSLMPLDQYQIAIDTENALVKST